MQQLIPHTISGNTFLLSADRCIFWHENKMLILSDLHLGKTGHFRKAGIGVPQAVFKEDMQRLFTLLQIFKPREIIIIGDMFHSYANKEHDFFLKWRKDFSDVPVNLVKGNHDILKENWYREADITISDKQLVIGDFLFTHDVADCDFLTAHYVFCGHIHPGVSIKGLGKQSLHFPCFHFGEQYAVLPAFSRFTGTSAIETKRGGNVFAIIENMLLQIQ